jgi:DNA polymerase elongation subunit (family B)
MLENNIDEVKAVYELLEERKPVVLKNKLKTKKIFGFDTETVDGRAVLVACSDSSFVFSSDFEDIARFLTQRRFTKSLNLFWNLDYDFFAILKHLPEEFVHVLYENKGLVYENYFIKWIPKKFFSIARIDEKQNSKFFDLWQFYRMSLNEAAQRYLNDRKEEINVRNIADYLKSLELKTRLLNYCIKDAKLTAQLGEILQQKLNSLNIDFSKPYSCGYISANYFFRNKPTFGFKKTEWSLYALLSYYGGRFEVLKRGYFSRIYQYDINSAYPFYISRLISPLNGEWVKTKDLNYETADYGFAKIAINGFEHDLISPLPWRLKSRMVIYPNFEDGLNAEYYISYPELKAAEEMGLEFDILDSWVFYGKDELLFSEIIDLYEQRKKAKKENDKVMELVLKIIMNSLYGKFAEKQFSVRAYLKQVPGSKEITVSGKTFYVKELNRPGLLFCPVLASYITALTRVQLLETAMTVQDYIVAFATDSILTLKQLDSSFVGEKLGQWKLETEGEAVVLMSGVYSIKNNGMVKSRFRGFPVSADFFKLLEENKESDKIIFEFEKAVKLGEIVQFYHQYSYEDLNIFRTVEKELSCFSDEKREWLSQPITFKDLLEDWFDSTPKTVKIEADSHKKRKYSGYQKAQFDWLRTREVEEIAWSLERMYI